MNVNTLGVVINYYRNKYNLQQTELCEGICSKATLSRIENGIREIDSLICEALLGRIGQEILQFEIILDEKDYKLWKIRDNIINCEENNDLIGISKYLKEYKILMPGNERLHMQYCDYYESKKRLNEIVNNDIQNKEYEIKQINHILYKALSYSKPNYVLEEERKQLYGPREIEIILLLIHHSYTDWKDIDKEKALTGIFDYVKKIYSEGEKERIGIKILMELITLAEQEKNYEKVIKYADDAIDFISKGRGVKNSADFHFKKAKAMKKINENNQNSEYSRKACIEECLMSYYVYDVMNQFEKRDAVEKYCREALKWHITKQETLLD